MKINWKVRFKNRVFLAQILLAFFVPILAYYGLTAQDLTTWKSLFDLIVDALSNPYVVFTVGVSIFNAVNDPTTKGVKDSDTAQLYRKPE